MRDVIEMWRNTRMVVLVALSAAIYAAILIPFKAIPIIPGITEIRPANAVPVVCAFLFGPAAAWGCAMGNLIGDFFGTIGPGSLFGLIGNFLLAYLPYRVWVVIRGTQEPTAKGRDLPVMVLGLVIGSAACAIVIGFGVDLLGIAPYMVVTTIITFNNLLIGVVLGLPLVALLYPRARRWRLTYGQIMNERDYRAPAVSSVAGVGLLLVSLAGALAAIDQRGVFATIGQHVGLIGPSAEAGPLFVPPEMSLREFGGWCSGAIVFASVFMARLWWGRKRLEEAAGEMGGVQTAPEIALSDLSFQYPDTEAPALSAITARQHGGTTRYLMGRTGAGKSTLALCLNGIIPNVQPGDYSGGVSVGGIDPAQWPVNQVSEVVGMVFQDFESQLFCSDVELEVAFSLENRGVDRKTMRARVDYWMKELEIEELRDRDPSTLSGGQKQRLALAAVMASEPPVVVLDEATTDLDPIGASQVFEACRTLAGRGRTLLMSTQDSSEAVTGDSLMVLRSGRMVAEGEPHAVLNDSERCRKLGIGPNPLAEIASAVGLAEVPASREEAASILRDRGASLDKGAYEASIARTQHPQADVVAQLKGVSFAYDGVEALRGIDLPVEAGDFVALLGPNGSGKTTMCRLLIGLLRPDAGSVCILGRDIARTDVSEIARDVGYLFQNPDSQIFADTVYDEVAFGPRNMGMEPQTIDDRVAGALQATELQGYEDFDPFALTRGERQRVALASILACDPRIIIFDEPTTGLDVPQQEAMFELLVQLQQEGRTIIMITHHMTMAVRYARRLVFLKDGRIAASGPTRQILRDDANLLTDVYGPGVEMTPAPVDLSRRLFGEVLLSPEEWAEFVTMAEQEE
ncbi:MAG: energy-coupling factor transporter ATPase [Armatimonadota bacterium]